MYAKDAVKVGIFVLITSVFFLYGFIEALPYIKGPEIIIFSPREGDTVASTTFTVSGQALRATTLTLSGKPITVDTGGYFSEVLVSHAPYTILTLEATDKYGKKKWKRLTVTPSSSL